MKPAVTAFIQPILAPVVMITACAITLNGVLIHYNAIGERLRSLHRESLTRTTATPEQQHTLEHLINILLHHHHLVHDAVAAVYLSILVFGLDMLAIALAAGVNLDWLAYAVIGIFLIGVAIFLYGILLIARQIIHSHQAIQLEIEQSCRSCRNSKTGLAWIKSR